MQQLIEHYGYWVVALGSALQGEGFLIMGGLVAHRGYLELVPWVILAAFVGGVAMNQIWFFLGRRYPARILAQHPKWEARVGTLDRWLTPHQDAMILAMQFMIGVRTVGYLALGISGVSYVRFSLLNGIGVLVWSAVVTTAGYLFGHAMQALLGDIEQLERPLLIGLGVIALGALIIEKHSAFRTYIGRVATR
jgi:membrane protein DedA with SNARE-associated domain